MDRGLFIVNVAYLLWYLRSMTTRAAAHKKWRRLADGDLGGRLGDMDNAKEGQQQENRPSVRLMVGGGPRASEAKAVDNLDFLSSENNNEKPANVE